MTEPLSARCDSVGWVTDLEVRQPPGMSHDVAMTQVLDLAQRLVDEGWDVTLRPTLPDEPAFGRWISEE